MQLDANNFGSDDSKMIQQCLNCTRPRCTNCLERSTHEDRGFFDQAVQQININTGKVIATFNSILEAEKLTGVSRISIRGCIIGRFKTGGGFRWKRVR